MLNNNFDEIRKARDEIKNIKNKMTKSELNKFYKDEKRKKVLKEREEKGIVVKIGRPKGPQLTKSQKKQMRRERYEKERALLHAKREAEGWEPKRIPFVSEEDKKARQKQYYLNQREKLRKYREENNILPKKRGRKPKPKQGEINKE